MNNNNNILIITSYFESPDIDITHYSSIKAYLLAEGLTNMGYNINFLSNVDNIRKYNEYTYINYNLLIPEKLTEFSHIFFILHNKEIMKPLHEKTEIFSNIQLAKKRNNGLKIIMKSCQYPKVLDEIGLDSYKFFDYFFLQTKETKIPSYVTIPITKNKKIYTVEKFRKFCTKNPGIKNKFFYSEMTFNKLKIPHTINSNLELNLDKKKINIVYLGRLASENGMGIIFLMKLAKVLGKNYMIYIIPGSFKIPVSHPPKKMAAWKKHYYDKFEEYINNYKLIYDNKNVQEYWNEKNLIDEETDYQKCNIKLLPQYTYGEHFKVLKMFDIGIGFSENKRKKVTQGSAKLFDYMACNLKIVFEDGWSNCNYVEKYNFGKLVSLNSTIDEFKSAIIELSNNKSYRSLYKKFIEEHNCFSRCQEIISKIN